MYVMLSLRLVWCPHLLAHVSIFKVKVIIVANTEFSWRKHRGLCIY